MARNVLRGITWFLIAVLTFGNPVSYGMERDRAVPSAARTLERLDADGKTLSRLIVKSRSRGDSVFVLERNDRVVGKGDVRFSPVSRSVEVTITAAETNNSARVKFGADGPNFGVWIEFDEMQATFSVDVARLRSYADEQLRVAAADPEHHPTKSPAELNQLRDLLKPTGNLGHIHARLAKSPLQDVVNEVGSMIVESNEADDTAALFAIRKAVGLLAPKVVLDHFKKTATPQVVAAVLGIPQPLIRLQPHQEDYKVADCDWVLFGACWAYFFIGVAGCFDMASHCISECWFDPDCSWSYIAQRNNTEACNWLFDSCLAFYGIVLALCVDQACQDCPDCQKCVINC